MRPVAKTILALKWPFRLAGIALAVFLAYFAYNFSSLYARVKLDRSYPALSRYAFERTPDVAIVGSSMSFRMYEGYFDTPLRNISIGGGSAATGLAIVASYRSLPKLVLVETNILSRRIEQNLVDAFGDNNSEPYQWFKPARAVVSWVYYYVKYSSEVEKVNHLPRLPPATYDIRENVNATIAEFAGKDWQTIMRPQARELTDLIAELERRGCRVVLFELPIVPELRDNAYFRAAHRLAHQAFPEKGRWLQISDEELRWVDSSHMDERSAILVAHQLDNFLRSWSFAR